jgi:hypothetical protein
MAITGAVVSRVAPANSESLAARSFAIPKGKPLPPNDQYSASAPYISDHAAAR